ncbi:MAG: hypothetical protein M3R25_10540 [Bacteroidota bacterium]|nr:hypothetical protein [Bacteroidota bacterium]
MFAIHYESHAQMPPPGYDRAKEMKAQQAKVLIIDRDSLTLIDTVVVYDPTNYEEEIKVIEHRISVRDFCVTVLGMSNPEILMDGQPHTIIDPRTYDDLIVRLKPGGGLDMTPVKK